jgi:hypothetical protein
MLLLMLLLLLAAGREQLLLLQGLCGFNEHTCLAILDYVQAVSWLALLHDCIAWRILLHAAASTMLIYACRICNQVLRATAAAYMLVYLLRNNQTIWKEPCPPCSAASKP